MPVAGLVVTVGPDAPFGEAAVASLRGDARIEVGVVTGWPRVPVVTDTATLEEQLALWHAITRTPGVLGLDLVYQDTSDLPDVLDSSLVRSRRRPLADRTEGNDHEPS
jgi:hypothetical protein